MDAKSIKARKRNAQKRINKANQTIRRANKQLITQLGKDINKKYKVDSLEEFQQKYNITPKK